MALSPTCPGWRPVPACSCGPPAALDASPRHAGRATPLERLLCPDRAFKSRVGPAPAPFLLLLEEKKKTLLIRGYAGSSLGRRVFERWSSSDRNALKASGAWPR